MGCEKTCGEPAAQIATIDDWIAQIGEDAARAKDAIEQLQSCDKRVARLVSRATWPLAFASRALADIADFLTDWSKVTEGTREQAVTEALQRADPELVVAQIDASIATLEAAFTLAKLNAEV